MSETGGRVQVVGTWLLDGVVAQGADGSIDPEGYGAAPSGYLTSPSHGRMQVIVPYSDRALLRRDWQASPMQDRAAAFATSRSRATATESASVSSAPWAWRGTPSICPPPDLGRWSGPGIRFHPGWGAGGGRCVGCTLTGACCRRASLPDPAPLALQHTVRDRHRGRAAETERVGAAGAVPSPTAYPKTL